MTNNNHIPSVSLATSQIPLFVNKLAAVVGLAEDVVAFIVDALFEETASDVETELVSDSGSSLLATLFGSMARA